MQKIFANSLYVCKCDANFPRLQPKLVYIFDFIHFFLVLFVKTVDFIHKLEIWRIKSKKYADFSRKSGKLTNQIKDDYYINWKNAKIRKN